MLIEVQLSEYIFPGFYNTDYDPDNIERDEEDFSEPDYDAYRERICDAIVDLVQKYIPFEIKNWELNSPRAYNYKNDEIYILIDTTPEEILYKLTKCKHARFDTLLEYIYFDEYEDDKYHVAILEHIIEMEVCNECDILQEISDQLWI